MQRLKTVRDVFEKLGGNSAVRNLTARKSDSVVSNWRSAEKFPADTFWVLSRELEKHGCSGDPALWGMTEPERTQ